MGEKKISDKKGRFYKIGVAIEGRELPEELYFSIDHRGGVISIDSKFGTGCDARELHEEEYKRLMENR